MEERVQAGTLIDGPTNIPIQMMSLTDRDGRITPQWFRLETENHEILMCRIEQVVSRGEKKYVGFGFPDRETTRMGEICKTLEMRYSVESQKWRIFQFL